MNYTVIGSNRDTLCANNEVTFLNIECSESLLEMNKFKVKNSEGDVIYKCKMNPIRRETHKITDAKDKTIAKFRLDMNNDLTGFNIYINSKNDNLEKEKDFVKNDYINFSVQPYDCSEDDEIRKYEINFFNKATGKNALIELIDRSYHTSNVSTCTVFDFKVYDGKQEFNAPLICDVSQSYSFDSKCSVSIQPGVEPLFIVVLYLCVYILRSYKFSKDANGKYLLPILLTAAAAI